MCLCQWPWARQDSETRRQLHISCTDQPEAVNHRGSHQRPPYLIWSPPWKEETMLGSHHRWWRRLRDKVEYFFFEKGPIDWSLSSLPYSGLRSPSYIWRNSSGSGISTWSWSPNMHLVSLQRYVMPSYDQLELDLNSKNPKLGFKLLKFKCPARGAEYAGSWDPGFQALFFSQALFVKRWIVSGKA